MNKFEEKYLNYNGNRIYYYTMGNPKNEKILMLHPAFGDHQIFDEQFKYFSKNHYLIAVDMVAHGKSKLSNSKVNMGSMPLILKEILDKEKIARVHVLGVSLGSLISQGLAYQFPYITSSVTIVGGYSIHKENTEIMKKQSGEMFKWLLYIIFSMKKFKEYVVNVSACTKNGKKIFQKGIEKINRKSFIGMNGMNKIFVKSDEPVPYPFLIICGEYDLDIAKNAGENLAKIESNAEYVMIKNAGHCANIDNHIIFNELYEKFISGN